NLGNPRRCAAGTAVCVAEGRPDADLKTPERRMCRAGRGGIRASTMETVVADAFELWKAMEEWRKAKTAVPRAIRRALKSGGAVPFSAIIEPLVARYPGVSADEFRRLIEEHLSRE